VAAVCNGISPIIYSVLLTAAQTTRFPGSPYALGGTAVLCIGLSFRTLKTRGRQFLESSEVQEHFVYA
jgi:hypothetical protein